MHTCYSLAVNGLGSQSHVKVRVYGHGALLGELTLRAEELACFRALFHPVDVPRRVSSGRWLAGDIKDEDWHQASTPTGRWSERLQRDAFVFVVPDQACPADRRT